MLLLQERCELLSRKAEWRGKARHLSPKTGVGVGGGGGQNVALFHARISKHLTVSHIFQSGLPSRSAKPPGPGPGIPTASSSADSNRFLLVTWQSYGFWLYET